MRTFWIVLVAAVGLAFGSPERFNALYEAERYAEAAEVAAGIASDHPKSWVWSYNAACAHALAGDANEAGRWLEATAARGFTGIATVENESDFDGVRGEAAFERGVEAVRAAAAARFEQFKQAALKAEPVVVMPPNAGGGRLPLVIVLHGTGGTGAGMARALRAAAADAGAILVAPDALRPARGERGFSWTYRDESAWYVEHLVERFVAEGRADPNRVVLVGHSQGANIALIMARTHSGRFAGVVPINGHYEPEIASMPGGEGPRARVYLLIGERDEWAHTYDEGLRDFEAAGYPVVLRRMPRRGHAMPTGATARREIGEALAWVLGDHKDSAGGESSGGVVDP